MDFIIRMSWGKSNTIYRKDRKKHHVGFISLSIELYYIFDLVIQGEVLEIDFFK